MTQPIESAIFFHCLTLWQQKLVKLSFTLLQREKRSQQKLDDYSFIVFPMAKAYEGFLKKFLFNMDLISKEVYEGRRFRIGRALNPDVYKKHRDQFWLFDDVAKQCSKASAQQLWETWLYSRNRVFHFFPREIGALSIEEAEKKLERVIKAMETAYQCMHQNGKDHNEED